MTELSFVVPNGRPRAALDRSFAPNLRDERGGRFTPFDHLAQVARAAEVAGFTSVLVPAHPSGDDPYLAAAALARRSRGLRIVAEIDPRFATPVYAAKMAVTFQRFSRGALGWRFELSGEPDAEAIARTDEFLTIARGVWQHAPYDHHGTYTTVVGGGLRPPLAGWPFPHVQVAGATPEVLAVSARHADVHVWPALAVDELASRRAALDALAGERSVGHAVQVTFTATDEADAVIDLVRSYRAVGVETFVLDAEPSLEAAYRLGRTLLPQLDDAPAVTR